MGIKIVITITNNFILLSINTINPNDVKEEPSDLMMIPVQSEG